MLSFHGIPERYFQAGDPYFCQCQATARRLRERLGLAEDALIVAFQSQVGRARWLQPYTERVLADAGYLDNDPLFRLMQLKFYARSVGNAILDQGIHVDNWTKEQAMDLMVRQTFQQQSEAEGKWIRAQLSSTQLATYFVGAQEHFDMRRAAEEQQGEAFDLKRYHDSVLAQGAPPVRFARQLLLDEPIR